MNFHNFSICAMLLKFCEECPGTLRFLRKIFFLLFDTYLYERFGACFCTCALIIWSVLLHTLHQH
jgi:hypothetical protein